jgi:hypothetical protein
MSTYVAVFALALGYVALVAAYIAMRTLAKLRRASAVLGRGVRGERMRLSLVEVVNRQAERLAVTREEMILLRSTIVSLREQIEALQGGSAPAVTAEAAPSAPSGPALDGSALDGSAAGALRNVALVRYDAFDGMSGRMSFSLALLDEAGDGIAISALAGQADTRVYAKGVTGGKAADQKLTPEEHQAVGAALDRRRGLLARKAG